MARVGATGNSHDGTQSSKLEKIGHLGSHTVTKASGRLLKSDVALDAKASGDETFKADRTVPDGEITKITDHLGRTFLFGEKTK